MTDVPADPAPPRDLPRPMRPAGRSPRVRADYGGWISALWHTLGVRTGTVALAAAVLFVALGAYLWITRSTFFSGDTVVSSDFDPKLVARVPPATVLQTIKPTFLGNAITAKEIAWVIDGGAEMTPFYADMTTLVATSMALMQPGKQKFGLYLISGDGAKESLPLVTAGGAAIETARAAMRKFKPARRAVIAPAFAQAAEWKPDEVFLVLSQPTDRLAVDDITRVASAAKIKVHIVVVGKPYHGWGTVSIETAGSYTHLTLADLTAWVVRMTRAAPSEPTGGPPQPGAAADPPRRVEPGGGSRMPSGSIGN